MTPIFFRVKVDTEYFFYRKPPPGTWYWQVSNSKGKSEVRSFTIEAPVPRKVTLSYPQEGEVIPADGGIVKWLGDERISYYRIELSNKGWNDPSYRFATSGTSLKVQGVTAGDYEMRSGSFSEVAGRWEYNKPIRVIVR